MMEYNISPSDSKLTSATAVADDDLFCFCGKFSLLHDAKDSLVRVISHTIHSRSAVAWPHC